MGAVFLGFLVVCLASNLKEITASTGQEHLQAHAHSEYYVRTWSHFKPGREMLEEENTTETRLPLVDTIRVDPLDKFRKYRGGYNITDNHYWSSTIFTGIYGYVMGAVWLLGGLIYAGFLLWNTYLTRNTKKRKATLPPPYHTLSYSCTFFLGIVFTLLVIIASGVVLGANSKFNSRATTIKNIVVEAADGGAETIYNVTRAMQAVQDYRQSNDETFHLLNSMSEKLVAEAMYIQQRAHKKRHLIDKGLKILFATTTVIVTLNMILVIVLLGLGLLRLHRALYLIIFICWLLTVLCWMYFGVYFFIDKFAGDTCLVLEEYREDPHNSSLSTILPCDDLLSARYILLDARESLHDLINQVNANISMWQATSSFHDLRLVCNPFSAAPEFQYQPENCTENTIRIGDIPQVMRMLTCSDSNDATCGEGRYISTETFNAVQAYTSSIQNLLDAIPGMESLVNCKLIKDAITTILSKQCGPIKKSIHMLWSAMAVLSAVMVALTLTWIKKAYQDGKYSLSKGSVKPDSAQDMSLEYDKTGEGVGIYSIAKCQSKDQNTK